MCSNRHQIFGNEFTLLIDRIILAIDFDTGTVGNIFTAQSLNQNIATAKTSGVDFQVDWSYDIGPGTLDVGVVGTWLENFETQALPGAPFVQFENKAGNNGPLGSSVGVSTLTPLASVRILPVRMLSASGELTTL